MLVKRLQRRLAQVMLAPMLRKFGRDPFPTPEQLAEAHAIGERLSPLDVSGLLVIHAITAALLCGSSCRTSHPDAGGHTVH